MEKQPLRQAVHRKPLPRPPLEQQADPNVPQQAAPPLPPRLDTEPGLSRSFDGLQLHHHNEAAGDSGDVGMPPPERQGTTSTTLTSTSSFAPTSASSTWTNYTDISTPATSGTSTPIGSRKPPAGAGQYGPGIGGYNPAPAQAASHGATGKEKEKKEPSFWKTALEETKFLAGGLLQKPFESTKHYTVMRHSPGLIMYRGPNTSIVVTVFSTPDHPLPADRTVWLQRRGFSGDTGLKLKTLVGASGSWLDVTPERRAAASDLPANDERAYQRDIAKLLKKAKQGEKSLAKRQPRETLVVRIPAAAADGYFRLVVCSGGVTAASATATTATATATATATTKRKVLCGSPVFRIASTSSDASIFRGASLRTLPMEMGVAAASMLTNNYVTNAAAPIVDAVQKYQPNTVQTLAAETVYDQSRLSSKVSGLGENYDKSREMVYQAYDPSVLAASQKSSSKGVDRADNDDDDEAPPDVIGPDSGPVEPFPIKFSGRVVRGTGRSSAEMGVPTANLADVPDEMRLRLRGVYFGWATVVPRKGAAAGEDSRIHLDWIEAVVTIGPSPWAVASASVVLRNEVAVHLLYDFGGASLLDAKLKMLLMGYLRPAAAAATTAAAAATAASNDDARVVVTSLSRPNWCPRPTLQRIETEKSGRSLSDKYVDTRGKLQRHVDKIPLHLAGVRTSGAELRDHLYGNGGFWIPR
ncbi:and nb-arc domain containing protein [Niveomyces insectorum RCEF 264]|uniref:Riboflavin kinase n=1 Tax=Niveomyces insectorum RCEF 264 TaxID=1081102 RepID=A0A167NGY1_9HYPO|nr:and nb-arc domain containing protein [Niveomyces insectorum RCEF 264]